MYENEQKFAKLSYFAPHMVGTKARKPMIRRGSQIRVIFLKECLVKVHLRSKGCLIQIRRHNGLVQDVKRLIVEHFIWSQDRVLNVEGLDTLSQIASFKE